MGKLKSLAEDWLEDCGYKLGYDRDSLPEPNQWKRINGLNYGDRENILAGQSNEYNHIVMFEFFNNIIFHCNHPISLNQA